MSFDKNTFEGILHVASYRVDGEMAQKVIEGDNGTCQHMHLILRWLKIRIIFASNSCPLRILSHLNIFELKNEQLRQKSTWSIFRGENEWFEFFECICLHVSLSSSMTFWAISPSLPYDFFDDFLWDYVKSTPFKCFCRNSL